MPYPHRLDATVNKALIVISALFAAGCVHLGQQAPAQDPCPSLINQISLLEKAKLRSLESKAEAASTLAEAELAVRALKGRRSATDEIAQGELSKGMQL